MMAAGAAPGKIGLGRWTVANLRRIAYDFPVPRRIIRFPGESPVMSFLQELRERRVPQIVSAYAVGSWGLVQFVQFLEGRLGWSPHVLNLVGLTLLLLVPAVVLVAWSQGRPGKDRWGRLEKTAIPLNLAAAAVLLFVLFQGKELRAVTTTVAVTDEHGATVERAVPRSEFLKRVMIIRPQLSGAAEDAWRSTAFAVLLDMDLSQDPFVDTIREEELVAELNEAGHDLAHRVPRTLQRKIARDRHVPRILDGSLERDGDELVLLMELMSAETGRVEASHELRAATVDRLADQASLLLRQDLGVPALSLAEQPDLPVAELVTDDPEALRLYILGVERISYQADWQGGAELLEGAVDADPSFALAHHLLSSVLMTLGRQEEAVHAEERAMAHLYRLPERVQFMVKAVYYINYEMDMDKSLAVLDMWTRLYPMDADAFRMKAQFHGMRNDVPAVIACYERVLEIDPTQYETLRTLGNLHKKQGDFPAAERYLRRYAEAFPANARALRSLASLHQMTGDLEEAEQVLERAQTVDPNDGATTTQLAGLYVDRGWYAEADELLTALAARSEQPTERITVVDERMDLLRRQGRIGDLVALLPEWEDAALHVMNPLFFAVQRLNALEPLADTDRAAWALAQVDSTAPTLVPMVQPFARMAGAPHLIALGRLDQADAVVEAGSAAALEMSLEVVKARMFELQGRIARARGDSQAAADLFRAALNTSPTELGFMVELGRSLREAGREGEARDILLAAHARTPARPDLNLELARLHRAKPEKARPYLETALKAWSLADTDFRPAREARALAAELGMAP